MSNSFSKTRALRVLLGAVIVCLVPMIFSVCATSIVNVPDDISPAEIIQRAQEASDRNRYNVALQYYEALLDRNLSNIDLVCTAQYEIAFIHYKQKKYAIARDEFNALLDYYNGPDAAFLPPQFQILARKVLEQIDEK